MRRDGGASGGFHGGNRRTVLGIMLVSVLALVASPAVALTGEEDDLGARALYEGSWSVPAPGPEDLTRAGPVFPETPPLSALHTWDPEYYADGCHAWLATTEVVPGCVYGDVAGDVEVAMIGDSKVGQLFPALEEIALREGWALRTYTKSACSFVESATPGYPECDTYNTALRAHLAQHPPDIALVGGRRRDVGDDYTRTWEWLHTIGVDRVVGFWDSPVPQPNPSECVAGALVTGTDLRACATDLPEDLSGNPSMRQAAAALPFADFVDLRDWVCPQTDVAPLCGAVIGGAQVYAEGSHMSQGYSPTLTDPIHQRLHELGVAAYRPSVDREYGRDRYATAADLSGGVAPGGRVFVASGLEYADALAAAPKAGADGGAVVLARPTVVPSDTQEALVRLAPSEIVVVGGPERLGEEVVQQLTAYAPVVRRVWGEDRYGTAEQVSGLDPVGHGGTVFVASGMDFPDALAAAAQAGQQDAPILLVRRDRIPDATARALQGLAPGRIVVVGGPVVVSDAVVQQLGAFAGEVLRRGGANRYETAALLATWSTDGSLLHVSVGTEFADALAAAPVAAAAGGAVLLVSPEEVPPATAQALIALAPGRVVLTGGPAAVDVEVHRALLRLVA